MAGVGNTYLDLADLYKQQENGKVSSTIIEILNETNEMLDDMIVLPCNEGTTHKTTVRTGLPSPTWKKLYQHTQPTKSTTAQVVDTTAMAEDFSEIDEDLVELADDKAQFRLNESKAHLQGISQDHQSKIIYGNTASDPEQFLGLAPRFNSLSAVNGNNIIDAGGTGSDNTSVWFMIWGQTTVHGIYPKGTMAGVQHKDLGVESKTDSSGGILRVYRDQYKLKAGVSLRDWRYVVRIANIDVSDLQAGTVDIYKYMRKAYWKLPKDWKAKGKAAIYCNSDVLEALDAKQTSGHSGTATVQLKPAEVQGKEVLMYRDIPLRQVDAILNTEAQIT